MRGEEERADATMYCRAWGMENSRPFTKISGSGEHVRFIGKIGAIFAVKKPQGAVVTLWLFLDVTERQQEQYHDSDESYPYYS
jgi:hypothetical protein